MVLLERLRRNAPGILCAVGIALALALHAYNFCFFEFKEEQAMILLNGWRLSEEGLFLTHGMESTVGFPNGPGMYQLAGLIAMTAGTSPEAFAAAALLASMAAPLLLGLLLYRRSNIRLALTASLLLSGTPMLIFLGANIWPPVFLPLFGTGILYLTSEAWRRNDPRWWCGACALTAVTGSIHLSAFFLVPGLLTIFFCNRWKWRWFFLAGAAGVLILAPWLWYLAFEWQYQRFDDPTAGWAKLWQGIRETANCFGGGFLAEYYGADWLEPLRGTVSGAGALCLLIAAAALPWIGVGRAAAEWIRREPVPAVVRSALVLTVSLLAGYLLLGVHVYYFYLFLPMPFLCVAAAWGISLWDPLWLRNGLPALWLAAALAVAWITLAEIDRGGGHPREYGPSYDFWRTFRQELRELEDAVGMPLRLDFQISRRAGERFSPGAIRFLLGDFLQENGQPVLVRIDYDPEKRQFIRNAVLLKNFPKAGETSPSAAQ